MVATNATSRLPYACGARFCKVDYAYQPSAAHQWNREEGLEPVLWELIEEFEAQVLVRALRNHHGLAMFGNPTGDALPDSYLQAIQNFGMRINLEARSTSTSPSST